MIITRIILMIALSVFFVASGATADILEDLVLNYSDFNSISCIAAGFTYVYFGTTNGVTRYNITEGYWEDPLNGYPGLKGDRIIQLQVSRDDENIWVQTEFGKFEYINTFERWNPVSDFPIDINPPGSHLSPTFDYFAPPGYDYLQDGVLIDEGNNRFPLTGILDDGWGNLWIGTAGLGVLWANPSGRRMEFRKFGLLQPDVTSIFSDNGTFWIGGLDIGYYRSGLTIFDWRNNKFDYLETSNLNYPIYEDINCIFGNKNTIFFGTDFGLLMADKKSREIDRTYYQQSALPGSQVRAVYSWGDSVFIGTDFGLGLVDLSPDSTTEGVETLLSPTAINALLVINEFLWIGTNSGTFRLNLRTGELGRMDMSNYAARGEVTDIERAGDLIWLATTDELVSIDSRTAKTEVYPDLIRYGGARAIAVNDTLVAAATREGLVLMWAGSKPRAVLYTANDGLLSNDVRDVVIDGEYVWVGTALGLTRFWLNSPSVY